MCGLTGFVNQSQTPNANATLQAMTDAIIHRGPDASGVWLNTESTVGLGHRRLSIQDLSEAGKQPMLSSEGDLVLAFNGEIYNHLTLREKLAQQKQSINWRGHSDTETLLACFEHWGIEKTLTLTTGMFAIALFNKTTKTLTLARDRMGEKPLYYGWNNNDFLFSSELKSLKPHPSFNQEIDRNALSLYVKYSYVPTPYSIYKGIHKLEPGHYITLDIASNKLEKSCYWDFKQVINSAKQSPLTGSRLASSHHIENMLTDAISEQMLSDVPLGAFLSGGIDSSLIVALMQSQSTAPINTFSIGFNESEFDEAVYARDVARHLGTHHQEMYISAQDALDVIPKLADIYCEPLGDSSQIPTFLVSQFAKQHVTVALTGDGGDELFCGYNRYLNDQKIWAKIQSVPKPLRAIAASILKTTPMALWNAALYPLKALRPNDIRFAMAGDKLHKLGDMLNLKSQPAFFRRMVSTWEHPEQLVLNSSEAHHQLSDDAIWPELNTIEEWMMARDTTTYMTDDILAKVDRASMATSLETRVPLLNHKIVEEAWRIPIEHKRSNNGKGKLILRDILYRHVPEKLIDRPKRGFSIPLDAWLRGELRAWAENLLEEGKLKQQGLFNHQTVRKIWGQHQNRDRDWQHVLWNILIFQAWLEVS